jgi:hypothetical protein
VLLSGVLLSGVLLSGVLLGSARYSFLTLKENVKEEEEEERAICPS